MLKEYVRKNPSMKIVLGILWGIGVGLLFRASCYGRKCVIIKAPQQKEVTSKVHKDDTTGKCYRLVSANATCTTNAIGMENGGSE